MFPNREYLLPKGAIIPLKEYSGSSPRLAGFILDQKAQNILREQSPYGTPRLPLNKVTVISDSFYQDWRTNGNQFTVKDKEKIYELAVDMTKKGPVCIRRAIYKREDQSVPLTHTYNDKANPDNVVQSLVELYTEYYNLSLDHPGDYVYETMLYNQIDPEMNFDNPYNANPAQYPVGGVAYPEIPIGQANGSINIIIESGFGDNAAISNGTQNQVDKLVYTVRIDRERNLAVEPYKQTSQIYPAKTQLVIQRQPKESWHGQPITESNESIQQKSQMYRIPIPQQIVHPTITEMHGSAIATHLVQCMLESGTTRKVEFTLGKTKDDLDNELGIQPYILENVSYTPLERKDGTTKIGTGPIVSILNTIDDLHSLKGNIAKNMRNCSSTDTPIVALSFRILEQFRQRPELRNILLTLDREVIFVGAFKNTEHVARGLDGTHTIANIGEMMDQVLDVESTIYQVGSRYDVIYRDGIYMLVTPEEIAGRELAPFLTITQARLTDLTLPKIIGGKACGMALLEKNHFPVPTETLTLTHSFFAELLKYNHATKSYQKLSQITNVEQLQKVFQEIYGHIKKIPPFLLRSLFDRLRTIAGDDPNFTFAIRSNLSIEDHSRHPMAGVYESELNVPLNISMLEKALLKVIKEYFNPKTAPTVWGALSNDEINQKLSTLLGSVIIQPMIHGDFSGTLFTHDNNAKSDEQKRYITLQYSTGVGSVVDGNSSKTTYSIQRDRNGIIRNIFITRPNTNSNETIEHFDLKQFSKLDDNDTTLGLPKKVIISLLRLGRNAEKCLGLPQDMEWAAAHNNENSCWDITFLQTRSILPI